MSAVVSAAGALLWMTHTLLQEHGWAVQGSEREVASLENFAGDVNLLPAQLFELPEMRKGAEDDTVVHVRALTVGNKLFVHLVSSQKSIRLSLKCVQLLGWAGLRGIR
jgi:hypothetical protein